MRIQRAPHNDVPRMLSQDNHRNDAVLRSGIALKYRFAGCIVCRQYRTDHHKQLPHNRIQQHVEKVSRYLRIWNLILNLDKTPLINFHHKRNRPDVLLVTDSRLTYKALVDKVRQQTTAAIKLHHELLVTFSVNEVAVYNSYVRRVIVYGEPS